MEAAAPALPASEGLFPTFRQAATAATLSCSLPFVRVVAAVEAGKAALVPGC